jgi:hypothetical protein
MRRLPRKNRIRSVVGPPVVSRWQKISTKGSSTPVGMTASYEGCATAVKLSSRIFMASSTSALVMFSGGDMRSTLP